MSDSSVRDVIRQYVQKRFQIVPDDSMFSDNVNLFDYGYVDSLGAVELIAFIEKEFSVQVDAADWERYRLDTIDGLADFVMIKREGH